MEHHGGNVEQISGSEGQRGSQQDDSAGRAGAEAIRYASQSYCRMLS